MLPEPSANSDSHQKAHGGGEGVRVCLSVGVGMSVLLGELGEKGEGGRRGRMEEGAGWRGRERGGGRGMG